MKYFIGIIIATLAGLGIWHVAVNKEKTSVDVDGIVIATSFYPLEFALERIVGEHGMVTNIGAGKDPHDFEPTTQDMLTLQQADLVVLQGADFEPWGDDVSERLEADGVPVVSATADLQLHEGGHHHHDEYEDAHDHEDDHADEHEDAHDGHDHGVYDPHTWLDPVLFSQSIDHLVHELAEIDSAHTDAYEANAAALQAELAALNMKYAETLGSCSLDEVITSHDAFGYVADRYSFEVHAIAGLSTQDMPSALTLASLKAEAEEGIGAILLEENSIAAYGETVAREAGLQTLRINPIAYIVPEGQNYLTLMEQNLNTFATALNCNE